MPIVRKVIKVGLTSFGVILPRSWLEYYGFPKKVEMTIQNDEITIRPPKMRKKK